MTTLFTPSTAEAERLSPFAQLRRLALFGGGFCTLGTIIWGFLELLKADPQKGIDLLLRWGPWGFVIGGCLAVLYALCVALIRARAESDARMAAVLDRLALGQERIATAAEIAAGKDDRQIQQMEILVSTIVMQSKRVLRRLHAQDRALERLEDKAGINRPSEDDDDAEESETP